MWVLVDTDEDPSSIVIAPHWWYCNKEQVAPNQDSALVWADLDIDQISVA
jgi:hypothetical protein